jgi:RNA polymerase sigma factor (sigma-70 family)
MTSSDPPAALAAVFRIEFPKVVATLARVVGDVGLAEDLAQDAIVEALQQWPRDGVPERPAAWLTTVAKRRAIDRFRREDVLRRKYEHLLRDRSLEDAAADADDTEIDDDHLRLIFVACHPVLPPAARAALTLRLVGGLTTTEIARAYLQSEPTIAQRIVRAKRTLSDANVPFEVPVGNDRAARLSTVLEVVYVMFNEGYTSTSGEEWTRPDLCAEATRLGRQLAGLLPKDAEVHGLLALMEIQSSRLRARRGPGGEAVLLLDQDRRKWDRLLINRGIDSLRRAERLAPQRGPYTLQAAIAACHATAFHSDETDWKKLVALYNDLAVVAPSPIVDLNRAVALAMAYEPNVGLELIEQLGAAHVLDGYHLFHSVRGDLLAKLGQHREAATDFERAAALTQNDQERHLQLQRAATSRRLAAEHAPPASS